MTEPTTDPTPEALHAVFRAAGWSYTPPDDIFSHAEWNVWTAAARALDAFAHAAVEKERNKLVSVVASVSGEEIPMINWHVVTNGKRFLWTAACARVLKRMGEQP